jgi:hypothetical protein
MFQKETGAADERNFQNSGIACRGGLGAGHRASGMGKGPWRPQGAQLCKTVERSTKQSEHTFPCKQRLTEGSIAVGFTVTSRSREHALAQQQPSFRTGRFAQPQRVGLEVPQPGLAAKRVAASSSEPDTAKPIVGEPPIAPERAACELGQPFPVKQRSKPQFESNLFEPESGSRAPQVEPAAEQQPQQKYGTKLEPVGGVAATSISPHNGSGPPEHGLEHA